MSSDSPSAERPGRDGPPVERPRADKPGGRAARRRRSAVWLVGGLLLAGFFYAAFAPGQVAAQDQPAAGLAEEGQVLFEDTCISCHGRNGEGVEDRGPSLIGVGAAAVEFQVSTGRMPLARQGAQAERKPPRWEGEELDRNVAALAAYIQALGGGPEMPPPGADLRGGDPAAGGELYRINCSSCHAYSGGGGALSSGAGAPSLAEATDRQIYAAMVSGPQNMPVFGDQQLTEEEKADIIAFIQYVNEDGDQGGVFNLGRFGPATEGLAIFLVGIVAMVFATLWIAGKS